MYTAIEPYNVLTKAFLSCVCTYIYVTYQGPLLITGGYVTSSGQKHVYVISVCYIFVWSLKTLKWLSTHVSSVTNATWKHRIPDSWVVRWRRSGLMICSNYFLKKNYLLFLLPALPLRQSITKRREYVSTCSNYFDL